MRSEQKTSRQSFTIMYVEDTFSLTSCLPGSFSRAPTQPLCFDSQNVYFVTLISQNRDVLYGSWVTAGSLCAFHLLTDAKSAGAADIPGAHEVFEIATKHLSQSLRDRLLHLSYVSYMVNFASEVTITLRHGVLRHRIHRFSIITSLNALSKEQSCPITA